MLPQVMIARHLWEEGMILFRMKVRILLFLLACCESGRSLMLAL